MALGPNTSYVARDWEKIWMRQRVGWQRTQQQRAQYDHRTQQISQAADVGQAVFNYFEQRALAGPTARAQAAQFDVSMKQLDLKERVTSLDFTRGGMAQISAAVGLRAGRMAIEQQREELERSSAAQARVLEAAGEALAAEERVGEARLGMRRREVVREARGRAGAARVTAAAQGGRGSGRLTGQAAELAAEQQELEMVTLEQEALAAGYAARREELEVQAEEQEARQRIGRAQLEQQEVAVERQASEAFTAAGLGISQASAALKIIPAERRALRRMRDLQRRQAKWGRRRAKLGAVFQIAGAARSFGAPG